nr:PHB depolymerase family esterase [Sinorhizobium meliloti]
MPGDIRREAVEALSVRQMIQTIYSRHNVTTERIYVTGLSAGGAMANVLLSTVPRPLLRLLPACHTQPRLPPRRHTSGCAGRASRNRENWGTEFSQHPFIRDYGRQSPSAWNEGQYGCGRCRDRADTRTSHASAEQHGCRSSPDGR